MSFNTMMKDLKNNEGESFKAQEILRLSCRLKLSVPDFFPEWVVHCSFWLYLYSGGWETHQWALGLRDLGVPMETKELFSLRPPLDVHRNLSVRSFPSKSFHELHLENVIIFYLERSSEARNMYIYILKNTINCLSYEPSQENRTKLGGECIIHVFVFNWLIRILFIMLVWIDSVWVCCSVAAATDCIGLF